MTAVSTPSYLHFNMSEVQKFIEIVLPYLGKWYTIAAICLVVYYVALWLQTRHLMRKLGCKPLMAVESDGLFGFRLLFTALKRKAAGEFVEYNRERLDIHNVDTGMVVIAGSPIYMTKDPENIKALLATQFNDFSLGVRHAQLAPLLGDGIFTLDGAGWKHSRAMLRPQFARDQVAHVKALEPHIQTFFKHILNTKGQKFDIQKLFFKLTIDSATEFLFGESCGSLNDDSVGMGHDEVDFDGKKDFAESFNVSQNYLGSRIVIQNLYFLIDNREFRAANAKVHKFANHYVNKALSLTPDELEKFSNDGYIFLYELVKQTRDPKVLRDQLLNILLAGRDTTAGLLSFTFFELARNKKVWEKLKEEIYEKFGKGDESRIDEITFESLKKAEYLKAVVNEALRMYPSVPQNFRVATKNTSLPRGGGKDHTEPVFIPKGQIVAYSVYATHRDSKYYGKDADTFRPERWFEPETKKLGWAFLPFNGGPRICLGQQFALTEASYVLTRLIQTFPDLESFDTGTYPPKLNSQLTMCHQDGVFLSLK